MATNHPGFQKVQAAIARRSGVGMERAGAILGAATRRASVSARRKNPRLNKVPGGKNNPVHPAAKGGGQVRKFGATENGETGAMAAQELRAQHPANHAPPGGHAHKPVRHTKG